jgi:acyl-coenzyme A thioesterase PaaI-like protein
MNLLLYQSAEIVTHSHTVTWSDPYINIDEIAKMSGLAYLQHLMNTGRAAPIGALMNMRGVGFERGKAVFEGTPADYHYNSIGVVHGGFAATLLDSALGRAVHTTLEAASA